VRIKITSDHGWQASHDRIEPGDQVLLHPSQRGRSSATIRPALTSAVWNRISLRFDSVAFCPLDRVLIKVYCPLAYERSARPILLSNRQGRGHN